MLVEQPPVQFAKLATFESLILIMRPSLSDASRTGAEHQKLLRLDASTRFRINNVAEKKENQTNLKNCFQVEEMKPFSGRGLITL